MFEFAWPWIFLLAPLPWLLPEHLHKAKAREAELYAEPVPVELHLRTELDVISGRAVAFEWVPDPVGERHRPRSDPGAGGRPAGP